MKLDHRQLAKKIVEAIAASPDTHCEADFAKKVVEACEQTYPNSVDRDKLQDLHLQAGEYLLDKMEEQWDRDYELEKLRLPKAGKVGRNAPCPCGSGDKHKRCCGRA